jgi:hypothetical protein
MARVAPEKLLAMGSRYVFYKSLALESSPLYQKLYDNATVNIGMFKNLFSNDTSMMSNKGSGYREAIAFLKKSAEFERQKELQFF